MKHFLSWFFNVWACIYIFLFHCDLHSLKVLYNKWCSFHYGVHYVKRNNWKISEPKNERCIILCFSYVFFILVNLFFDHLIKFCCITSLLYGTNHMTSTHLYMYKYVLKWQAHSSFKRKEKYLNVYNLYICQII